jgi:hypothetical protein
MNLPFTLPFALPDWLPPWAFLLLALPVLLWVLAFLLVPFSVIGVKARLEALETQLQAIQDDLRSPPARPPGVTRPRTEEYEELPNFGRLKTAQAQRYDPVPSIPPIPPAPLTPLGPRDDGAGPRLPARPARRMEPRLD